MAGTDIIRRATVEEIEGRRHKAVELYGQAFDLLAEARKMAELAAPSAPSHESAARFDDAARDAIAPTWHGAHESERREKFISSMTKQLDRAVWLHLLQSTDLERLMDKKARDQFRQQLRDDPPETTAETCYATLSQLVADSGMIFRRGIAEAFSKLDRRFRSHDGFKIGSRIILSRAFTETGSWNHYGREDETLRDVERVFCVLDGDEQPERAAGIIGVIEGERRKHGYGAAAYECENEYFRVRVFKNGNAHVWFLRDDLLLKVNKLLAEYYGEALGAGADVSEVHESYAMTPAKNFGLFETPDSVAQRVIEEACLYSTEPLDILEPSAGGGNLVKWADPKHRFTCVEIQSDMASALSSNPMWYGRAEHRVICADFLAENPDTLGRFDRIIMNPPFDRGRDVDHVNHALKFLKPGGRLVAIMSASTEFREDAKTNRFRATVERLGGCFYDLPAGSFRAAGTNVNTCIVTMNAPTAARAGGAA